VKVIAECFEDNVPSRKTWERAGFVVDEEKTGGIVRRGEEEGGDRKEVVYKYTRGG
jgi:RimJ/RimL family protein N-acetyltransferase